jgi:hypothetical protein
VTEVNNDLTSDALKATTNITVLWNMTPYSLLEMYPHFKGISYLQRLHVNHNILLHLQTATYCGLIDTRKYTIEQQIVISVWTRTKINQVCDHFQERFGRAAATEHTSATAA